MRTVIITKDNMDYSRAVDTFLGDFKRQTGQELEVLNPDSPEGDMFCRTYDIVEYPTIIALSDEGHMQNMWSGSTLPTISEVSYYVTQG